MNLHIAEPMTRTEIIGKTTITLTQQALDCMQPSTWGNLLQVSVMIPPKSEVYSQIEGVSVERCHAALEEFAVKLAKGIVPREPYSYHPTLAALDGSEELGWYLTLVFGLAGETEVADDHDIWAIIHSVWGPLNARHWVEAISVTAVLGLMGRLQLLELRDGEEPSDRRMAADFHDRLLRKIEHAEKLTGDDLGGIRNLITDITGVEVAKLLIDNTALREPPKGFLALTAHNLHYLTIEQAIVDYESSGLFDEEAIRTARARLAIFSRERN